MQHVEHLSESRKHGSSSHAFLIHFDLRRFSRVGVRRVDPPLDRRVRSG